MQPLRLGYKWESGTGSFASPPISSPLTHTVYLFELFSWLQKRFQPFDPDTMTNTAAPEATASSSGKKVSARRRWGTSTDASAAMVAHRLLSSVMCSNNDNDWPVHSLMLSHHELRGLPLQRLPSTIPCILSFGSVRLVRILTYCFTYSFVLCS